MDCLQAHLCFCLLPTKTIQKKVNKCHSAKTKKNPKPPEIGKCVCSEKKKKNKFPRSLEAVGEGDERVISLQSRIALVDQFANVAQRTWGWIDGYYPLTADGRGIEWKRMFGYPQVIFFWKWSCHKRLVLIVKPYQDIRNIIPKYEKELGKTRCSGFISTTSKGVFLAS